MADIEEVDDDDLFGEGKSCISSDTPDSQQWIDPHHPVVCNPVSAPADCDKSDLE